ncbi:hypothetical protein SUGI_0281500 [Cryptomeria japonica]|nr:hypothetical protein SUGI_0281500 [Cryptomeria japonica]
MYPGASVDVAVANAHSRWFSGARSKLSICRPCCCHIWSMHIMYCSCVRLVDVARLLCSPPRIFPLLHIAKAAVPFLCFYGHHTSRLSLDNLPRYHSISGFQGSRITAFSSLCLLGFNRVSNSRFRRLTRGSAVLCVPRYTHIQPKVTVSSF